MTVVPLMYQSLSDKLDAKSELCLFGKYAKGKRGYYFYRKSDMKIFVSTNSKFIKK